MLQKKCSTPKDYCAPKFISKTINKKKMAPRWMSFAHHKQRTQKHQKYNEKANIEIPKAFCRENRRFQVSINKFTVDQ